MLKLFFTEHNPYIRSIKLQSLQDNVKISLTSENAENALEVSHLTGIITLIHISISSLYIEKEEISSFFSNLASFFENFKCFCITFLEARMFIVNLKTCLWHHNDQLS